MIQRNHIFIPMTDEMIEDAGGLGAVITQRFWMMRLAMSGIYTDHDWPAQQYVWSGRFQRRAKRTRLVDRMRAA